MRTTLPCFACLVLWALCTSVVCTLEGQPQTADAFSISLLQTVVRYRLKNAGDQKASDSEEVDWNFTQPSQDSLASGQWADTCGTRLVQPQLQFDLQVYHKLGLVRSPFAHCELPSAKSLASLGIGEGMTQNLTLAYSSLAPTRRDGIAKAAMGVWGVLAAYFLFCFLFRFFGAKRPRLQKRKQQLTEEMHVSGVWQHGFFHWFSMSWLDPLVDFYRQMGREVTDPHSMDLVTPVSTFTPSKSFADVWAEEVQLRGLDQADLLRAIRTFLGTRIMLWLLFTAALALLLEFVGMALVLDVLLNYLEWARSAQAQSINASLDMLAPTLMIVCLGFGAPMAARAFTAMLTFWDGCCTNALVHGLLTVVYAKCHKLPDANPMNQQDSAAELIHLLNNDIVRSWKGALVSYAYLAVVPLCVCALMGLLVFKLGWSAILGGATTCWICFLYMPICNLVRQENMIWQQLTDARLRALKELVTNMRAVKLTGWEESLCHKVCTMRDAELDSQFHFMMTQSLLNVPLNLFPFALMFSSLFFDHVIYDRVSWQDIFVCMQILVGLNSCVSMLTPAVHKVVNIPNSVKRLELFLQEPERQANDRCNDESGLKHVRLCGSFTSEGQAPILHNVDFAAQPGSLVAVIGAPGSGKSAFLSAVLGDLQGVDGAVHVEAPANVTYCSQEPWIVEGSLQDNVTLGEDLDEDRYDEALLAAGLLHDADASEPKVKGPPPPGGLVDQYFFIWDVCTVIVLVASILNVKWDTTHPIMGVLVVMIQGLLHWSVLEIPLQTLATMFVSAPPVARADRGHLTMCVNYNLLALGQADIDECMANMYEAYIGNIDKKVSSCLVSATNEPSLKEYELQTRDRYRKQIYDELYAEGLSWAGLAENPVEVDAGRLERLWSQFEHIDRHVFVQGPLKTLCERFAQEFMVVHRVTRVLRKCGQYQDLILLSAGEDTAYTYCDKDLYAKAARKEGELLFHPSEDCDNVRGRHFDYTLVLDSDTRVIPDTLFELLEIGAAHPDRAIIQPAINLFSEEEDTIFMHLESMRQCINESMTNAITAILGKSSFFGKGLIKNSPYMERLLGSRHKLVERVPIDVLSHDTFEAAVMQPLYANSVQLLEAPSLNYVTWDIRERRWNRGELVLAMHFWPSTVGRFTKWLQYKFQGKAFNEIKVRTDSKLDKVSNYVAHGALRQMLMKVFLVVYIITVDFVEMHYELAPICIVMFLIIVFPKFATCSRDNWKPVLIETFSSIIQFTPEAVVGTIRVMRAMKAHVTGNARWVPQKAVEEEFKLNNPFTYSLRHLWYYPVFAVICGLVVICLVPDAVFTFILLGTLFILPVYVGLTALSTDVLHDTPRSWFKVNTELALKSQDAQDEQGESVTDVKAEKISRRRKAMPVGPRGIQLSSGQQSCIALARAAYNQDSDVVLLDEPFSAVDAATAEHIFSNLIQGPLMSGKTRIVVLQPDSARLRHFDQIVLLSEGRVLVQGTPETVLSSSAFQQLASQRESDRIIGDGRERQCKQMLPVMKGSASVTCEDPKVSVPWSRILELLLTGGVGSLLLATLLVCLQRASVVGLMLILGRWADGSEGFTDDHYIHVVVVMAISLMFLQILQDYFVLTFSREASGALFRRAMQHVVRAPIDKFWDKQPTGRVINRLSGDMLIIDFGLSSSFSAVASFAFGIAIQQGYCMCVMPWWLVAPVYVIIFVFLRVFWDTAAPLQHFAMLALSKCQDEQVHINQGKASASAYRYQGKLAAQYSAFADLAMRLNFICIPCSKMWFISRLSFCLCFQSTVFVLYSFLRPDAVGLGTVGVLLASTFSILQEIGSFADGIVQGIAAVVSLNRVQEYFDIPQERARELPDDHAMRYISVSVESYKVGDVELRKGTSESDVTVHRRGGGPLLEASPDGSALRLVDMRRFEDLAPGHKDFRESTDMCDGFRVVAVNGVAGCAAAMAEEFVAKTTKVQWLNLWGPSLWNGVDVQILGLHAGYGTAESVFKDVSINLAARSKTCLVGASGSGKTTLLMSCLQAVEPRAGRILLSGVDTRNIGVCTLRRLVMLLPQHPAVRDGSIRSNLDPQLRLPDDRIWSVLSAVNLGTFVKGLSSGLDTPVSQDACCMSFGQRQLLCLARAVCVQPPLLLLDDCLSSVDPMQQVALQHKLGALLPNSTIIAVARTPDGLSGFDDVVVLKSGIIAEQGSVSQLLSHERGLLCSMLRTQ